MCFTCGKAQVDDQVLDRKTVDAVLDMLEPGQKIVALLGRYAFRLMREIGGNVAVGEDDFTRAQGRLDFAFGFEAVAGIQQSGKMRVHRFQRTKLSVEIAPGKSAERRFILRERDAQNGESSRFECLRQQIELRA